MRNNGFTTIGILGIIGLLVFGGIAYFLGTMKESNNSEISNNSSNKVEEVIVEKTEQEKEDSTPVLSNIQEEMEIELYFGNEIKNPGSFDCSLVYPVKRKIPKTQSVARVALEELIKGPTEEEAKLGYYGTMPRETRINSINIKDGVLSIDFSKEIENNFASCSGNYRLTSITKTMTQFPSVKEIKLGVNNNWNRDEILQP